MWPTWLTWVLAGITSVLIGYGALVESPMIAIKGGLVGLWLLIDGFAFAQSVAALQPALEIPQSSHTAPA